MNQVKRLSLANPVPDLLNYNFRVLESNQYILDAFIDDLVQLRSDLGMSSRLSSAVSLGHTLGDYSDWTEEYTFNGYSIWSYPVSDYAANDLNTLVAVPSINEITKMTGTFDNLGVPDAKDASYFEFLYAYDGSSFSSNLGGASGDLSPDNTNYANLLTDAGTSYFYVGESSKFYGWTIAFKAPVSGLVLTVEYYNGSAWVELEDYEIQDDTTGWKGDGRQFIINDSFGSNWQTTSVNSQTKYWYRIAATSFSSTPVAYSFAPVTSVETLLVRSRTQLLENRHAFCYYDGDIYVTLPSVGNTHYLGRTWVNTDDTTKKSFFVYYNHLKLYHLLSSWPEYTTGLSGQTTMNGTTGVVITHNLGHTNYMVDLNFTDSLGTTFSSWMTKANNSVTLYCTAGATPGVDYQIRIT